MTVDGAIRSISSWVRTMEGLDAPYLERTDIQYKLKIAKIALAALKAQKESERCEPLPWEELVDMDGQPVWIVETSGCNSDSYWAIINILRDSHNIASGAFVLHEKERKFKSTGDEDFIFSIMKEQYGKKLLVYCHPPKEAQDGN